MSTEYYGLPTVEPTDKFAPSKAINNLADRIDHVLQHVEQVGADSHYTLPPATKNTLGGVIAGDNVNITADGTISVELNPYKLPAASYTKLGGVKIAQNEGFTIDPDGTLHIDDKTIGVPANSVTEEKIKDNAITANKIKDNSVTYEKLSANVQNTIEKTQKVLAGETTEITLDTSVKANEVKDLTVKLINIAGFYSLTGNCTIVADGTTAIYDLFRWSNPPETIYGNTQGNILAINGDTAYVGVFEYTTEYIDFATVHKYKANFGDNNLPAGTYTVELNAFMFGTAN